MKTRLARFLRDVGDALSDIAERLDPLDWSSPEEREMAVESILARVNAKRLHACPECRGEGAVKVPDGIEPCPMCDGFGVDSLFLAKRRI